jgi:hypothetical protein
MGDVVTSGGFSGSSGGDIVVTSGGFVGTYSDGDTGGASGGASSYGAEVLQPPAIKTATVTAIIAIKFKTRFFILPPPIHRKFWYTHLIITCDLYAYNTRGREIVAAQKTALLY